MGLNDTIFLYSPSFTYGGAEQSVVLFGPTATGVDFDLYVRCNAIPTPTAYDFTSQSPNRNEMVHLPSGSCNGGTWHFAIHSFAAGTGQFSLILSEHKHSQHFTVTAGIGFTPTSTQLAVIKAALRNTARTFWGMTEGTQIVDEIKLWNNGSCNNCGGAPCKVCYLDNPLIGASCSNNGIVTMTNGGFTGGATDWRLMAHEWGHCLIGLSDEYIIDRNGLTQLACGHSMMASHLTDNNNLCYGDYPVDSDHMQDGAGVAGPQVSGWESLHQSNRVPWLLGETPDNFDYINFDFNGQVGVVTDMP